MKLKDDEGYVLLLNAADIAYVEFEDDEDTFLVEIKTRLRDSNDDFVGFALVYSSKTNAMNAVNEIQRYMEEVK